MAYDCEAYDCVRQQPPTAAKQGYAWGGQGYASTYSDMSLTKELVPLGHEVQEAVFVPEHDAAAHRPRHPPSFIRVTDALTSQYW